MGILSNAKHELFAQGIARGKTQDEAYVQAGYKRNRRNASRLRTNEDVIQRIAELVAKAAEKFEVTLESLVREADAIQRDAHAAGQYSAASGALQAKAKLAGLWVEKSENTNRNVDATRITDEQLAEIIGEDEALDVEKPSELH